MKSFKMWAVSSVGRAIPFKEWVTVRVRTAHH